MPIPRSPLTMTADLLKFVGAGGFARVVGANVLVWDSNIDGMATWGLGTFGPTCVIAGVE